jgi:hypothetical protein
MKVEIIADLGNFASEPGRLLEGFVFLAKLDLPLLTAYGGGVAGLFDERW